MLADASLRRFCASLPKAELHAHLHGSARLSTIVALAPPSARTTLHRLQQEQPKPKSRGWRRYLGMLLMGSLFGYTFSCLLPPREDAPWRPAVAVPRGQV